MPDIEVAEGSTVAAPPTAHAKSGDLVAKYVALAKEEAVEAAPEVEAKPGKPAKADKGPKAEAKPAKIDPKTIKLEEPEAAKPEPEGDVQAKARYYLAHGDVAKAIDTALGDLTGLAIPDEVREAIGRKLGVKSDQWEKIRKYEKSVKHQAAQREQQVSQLVDQVRREYGPLVSAREAYQKGDYDAAFKSAFGEDAADFQRKLIGQRVAKNPEVEQVKALLERERQERLADKQALAAEQQKAAEQRDINQYVANLQTELTQSDDPQVAKYAERPRFVQRVFAIQAEHYDARTNTTMPVHKAAEIARDEVLGLLNEWEFTGSNSEKSDQAAAKPEQPPRASKGSVRNLRQASAAEAQSAPRKLNSQQLREKYTKLIELSRD